MNATTKTIFLILVLTSPCMESSEAIAAACAFPLFQNPAQSCDGLIINLGQSGGISNSGTINSSPTDNYYAIQSFGNITSLINSDAGTISGGVNGIVNEMTGAIASISNRREITGNAGSAIINLGVVNSLINYGGDPSIIKIVGALNGILNSPSGVFPELINYGMIKGISTNGIYNQGKFTSIQNLSTQTSTRNATIYGGNNGIFNNSSTQIVSLTNNGIIQGAANAGIENSGSINVILNNSDGSLANDLTPDSVYNGGIIKGGQYGITNNSLGTISSLSNSGTIQGLSQSGISNSGIISSLVNNVGYQISGSQYGILNASSGTIQTITNFGAITGSLAGINNNSGSINTLNNAQSSSSSNGALVFTGKLPSFYNVIFGGSSYGSLAAVAVNGTTSFGIYSGSSPETGTYNSIISGLLASQFSSLTGVSGSYSWSLVESTPGSNIWNVSLGAYINSSQPFNASNLSPTANPSFAGGTLEMNQTIATYPQNFTVSNSATNTINQDGNISTFTGVFSNASGQVGNIVITNSGYGGKVIFTGSNTYTGTTTISSGATVAINGSMLSNMVVEAGGTLQGNGSFAGGTINAGAFLAPGNSIGTITSNGNLTFASGSTYAVEVDAAGNSDKTVVNGAANIQGGTVAVSGSLPSTPVALSKTKYTILTATNGVSGRFANVTGLPTFSFLTGGLTYGANDVTLGYTFATPFSTVAKNINQRNVGNALTLAALGSVNALGAPILNALFYGNYQNAQAVMDTVSGSGLAGVQTAAMQVSEMASSSVSDQIAFWRSGETQDATGISSQEANNSRSFMAYAPVETSIKGKGPIIIKGSSEMKARALPRTFRAWGSMFGGGANYLSDVGRGSAASNLGYFGGLMGVDYQIQPNLLIGAAVGGSSANFNVGSLSTNGALTGFHAGLYGAYTMGASYLALNETFSGYSNQTSRKAGGYALMPYEQLSAQFGSTEFRTRLEGGHSILMGGLKATPFVAAEIAAYQSNYFAEKSTIVASTFALKNNGQSINSLPAFVGLRLSNGYTLSNGWRLAPIGSVAYVHEFFPQRQFTNMLISMPGTDLNVSGPRSTYNLVQTKLGAQLNLTNKLALFSDFQGEFSPMSQSYGGKAGMKYTW